MANGIWYGSVSDQFGRGVNQAIIRVTDPDTDDLLGLFKDRAGTMPIGNPFLTRENGAIKFFVRAGRINVSAVKGEFEEIFADEIIADDWGSNECACGVSDAFVNNNLSHNGTEQIYIQSSNGDGSYSIIFGVTFSERPDDYTISIGNVEVIDVQQHYVAPSFDSDGYYFVMAVIRRPVDGGYASFFYMSPTEENPGDLYSLSMDNVQQYLVDDLAPGSGCVLETSVVVQNVGNWSTGVVDSACDKSFAAFAIYSPVSGMANANADGFDYVGTSSGASPSSPQIGWTNNYKTQTETEVYIGVSSGTIVGGMVVLRTSQEGPGITEHMVVGCIDSPYVLNYKSVGETLDYSYVAGYSALGPAVYAMAGGVDEPGTHWIVAGGPYDAEMETSLKVGYMEDGTFYAYPPPGSPTPTITVTSVAIHPSGLYAAAQSGVDLYMLSLISDVGGIVVGNPTAHDDARGAVAFSPTGRYFALGSNDSSDRVYLYGAPEEFDDLRYYSPSTWVSIPLDTNPSIVVRGAVFSPNDQKLAVLCANTPYLLIYNTADGAKQADPASLPTNSNMSSNVQMAWSPDGEYLAFPTRPGSSTYSVIVYRISDMEIVATLLTGAPAIFACAFNKDSTVLAITSAAYPFIHTFKVADWSLLGAVDSVPSDDCRAVFFIDLPDA